MNKLLLTTALVAVSGAAVAEISWSGSAEFGWNSHVAGSVKDVSPQFGLDPNDPEDVDPDWLGEFVPNDEYNELVEIFLDDDTDTLIEYYDVNGLYYDASLDATGTAELDNGVTASITYGINLNYSVDGDAGNVTLDDFPTVKIESSIATLTIGDVDHAAHDIFVDSGAMDVGFTEADGELVGRVDTTLAGQTVGISYQASNQWGEVANNFEYDKGYNEKWDILSIGAAGEFSSFSYTAGYEQGKHFTSDAVGYLPFDLAIEDYTIWGVGAGFEYAGATIGAAIAQHEEADVTARSFAIGADYEMANGVGLNGALSWNDGDIDDDVDQVMGYEVGASFNAMGADISVGFEDSNTDDDVDGVFTADAKYDMGNGIVGYAGYDGGEANVIDEKIAEDNGAFYAGVEYALGNGAQLVLSHAQFDEAGDPDFKAGTTLAVTLDF